MRSAALLRADALRIARDPMLLLLSTLPLALAVGARLVAPAASMGRVAPPDAPTVAEAVTAVLLLLTPMMFGFVYGLMLLDERDEGVLAAVALTPVGTDGFLRRRMGVPILWSALAALAVTLLSGLVPIAPARLLGLGMLAGLQAPLLALFLGAFAPDKARGMALAKVGSVLIGIGALAVLLPAPWRWLASPSPHFWLARLVLADDSRAWAWATELGLALAVHVGVLAVLVRRFRSRMG